MAGRQFTKESRLRHVRWRVLMDLLYNKSHIRPQANQVLTSPTKLTKSCQTKAYRVSDSLDWLKEMGYVNKIEWGYGRVLVEINLSPLQHLNLGSDIESPSSCALDGGTQNVIVQPPEPEQIYVSDADFELLQTSMEQGLAHAKGEIQCQETLLEVPDLKDEPKKPLKTSTRPVRGRLKLRLPSNTE